MISKPFLLSIFSIETKVNRKEISRSLHCFDTPLLPLYLITGDDEKNAKKYINQSRSKGSLHFDVWPVKIKVHIFELIFLSKDVSSLKHVTIFQTQGAGSIPINAHHMETIGNTCNTVLFLQGIFLFQLIYIYIFWYFYILMFVCFCLFFTIRDLLWGNRE